VPGVDVSKADERMLAGYFAASTLMARDSLFLDFYTKPVPPELTAGQ
jgi:hypothetical protein